GGAGVGWARAVGGGAPGGWGGGPPPRRREPCPASRSPPARTSMRSKPASISSSRGCRASLPQLLRRPVDEGPLGHGSPDHQVRLHPIAHLTHTLVRSKRLHHKLGGARQPVLAADDHDGPGAPSG